MGILSPLYSIAETLLFPRRCAFCGDFLPEKPHRLTPKGNPLLTDVELCGACQDDFEPPLLLGCKYCGAFKKEPGFTEKRCALCREAVMNYDEVIPFGKYENALREAILAMKLPRYSVLGESVAELFWSSRHAALKLQRADVLIPVPMHWFYRRVRGVNSPEIVARVLSKHLGAPVNTKLIFSSRMTLSQRSVDVGDRGRNVASVFQAYPKADPAPWRGKRAILVDDVITTGATSNAIAKLLKEHFGFAHVTVACLAKASTKTWRAAVQEQKLREYQATEEARHREFEQEIDPDW